MKKLLFAALVLFAACKNEPANTTKSDFTPPKSGTTVAADSILIEEDKLNHQYFGVTVIATDSSINGTYDIEAHWGFNMAVNTIRMPIGGEHFEPILRRGTDPYSFIVGFRFDNDTAFHEYYAIDGQRGQMMMKYVKAYTLQ